MVTPFKRKAKNKQVTNNEIVNIFEQNNCTNKYLHVLGEYLILKSSLAPPTNPKSLEASTFSIQLFNHTTFL